MLVKKLFVILLFFIWIGPVMSQEPLPIEIPDLTIFKEIETPQSLDDYASNQEKAWPLLFSWIQTGDSTHLDQGLLSEDFVNPPIILDSLDCEGADDFVIDGCPVKLTNFIFIGDYTGSLSSSLLAAKYIQISIFTNNSGYPGTLLYSGAFQRGVDYQDSGGRFMVTMPSSWNWILQPGKYWISCRDRFDFSALKKFWYWGMREVKTKVSLNNYKTYQAVWRNPDDIFETGATDWTSLDQINWGGTNLPKADFRFAVFGEFEHFRVTYPNKGTFFAGNPLTVFWQGCSAAPLVDLLFSGDGGEDWFTVAYGIPNTGSYNTFVPGYPTTTGVFKIVNTKTPRHRDISNNYITIIGSGPWIEKRHIEAEEFTLFDWMKTGVDGTAFNSHFIYCPDLTGDSKATQISDGIYQNTKGEYELKLSDGLYVIYGRSYATEGLHDSWWVSVDDKSEFLWDTRKYDDWVWDVVSHRGLHGKANTLADADPILFQLEGKGFSAADPNRIDGGSNEHIIRFRTRESMTFLDCIFITNDLTTGYYNPYPKQTVELLTPPDSAQVQGGQDYEITWVSKGLSDTVSIDYSFDESFTNPILIAFKTVDDSSFIWNVPDTTAEVFVRISHEEPGMHPMDQNFWPIFLQEDTTTVANYALSFNGASSFANVEHNPDLNLETGFTIAFWLKTSNPNQGWTRILEKGFYDEYAMGFYGNTGKICGSLRTRQANGLTKMSTVIGPSKTILAPDTWYHVAATYDGINVRLFVNGVEETVKTATMVPRKKQWPLIIGAARKQNGVYQGFFDGVLDELQIWNVARTAEQIQAGMFEGLEAPATNLMAYYKFDQTIGDVLPDISGHANDGLLAMVTGGELPSTSPAWVLSDIPTGLEQMQQGNVSNQAFSRIALMSNPEEFTLMQNYPNPFNPGTTITFNVPMTENGVEHVTVEVYNIQGRLICTLIDQSMNPGLHQAYWNGTTDYGISVANGIYFYRMQAGVFQETKRMVLLK